jgi:hypothetical protein
MICPTDVNPLRDIFSFAATSYLSLRVQLYQFESAFAAKLSALPLSRC